MTIGDGEAAAAAAPCLLDARGKKLDPKFFLEAYHDNAKGFDEEGSDVRFCKNIHLKNPDDFVEYCPRGVVLAQSTSSGSLLWDAWIRKVPNEGHEAATTEIGRQIGNYAVAMSSKFDPEIQAGGGHRKVGQVDLGGGDVLPERRIDPDQALRVVVEGDTEPRVVIEVELSNRDPLPLAKHVHVLMRSWDHLRCVIGLKIYKRTEVGEKFACVCFVWKKRSDNTIHVERVFDVGPKPSSMRSHEAVAGFWRTSAVDFSAVSPDNGNSFQVEALPSNLDYPLPRECPDELEDHFTISIDKADIYHDHTPTKRNRSKKPKNIEDQKDAAPLDIDLFTVLRAIDKTKTRNFA
jgi:hypothetical protein